MWFNSKAQKTEKTVRMKSLLSFTWKSDRTENAVVIMKDSQLTWKDVMQTL